MKKEGGQTPKQELTKAENLISDPEIGLSYRETIIDLPEHRTREVGINRVRRREVLAFPEELVKRDAEGNIQRYRTMAPTRDRLFSAHLERFYQKITDNKFPSYRVWDHSMNADTFNREEKIRDHVKEGIYLQRIWAGDSIELTKKFEKEKPAIFNMALVPGNSTWDYSINTPCYFFGNQNKNLVEYIESILKSDYALAELKKAGWTDKPLDLIAPEDPKYGEILFPSEIYGDSKRFENDAQEEIERLQKAGVYMPPDNQITVKYFKNLDMLRKFIEGVPIYLVDPHRYIPVIQHPDIKPLRWCHAEMALVPTRRNLNVLFFETD